MTKQKTCPDCGATVDIVDPRHCFPNNGCREYLKSKIDELNTNAETARDYIERLVAESNSLDLERKQLTEKNTHLENSNKALLATYSQLESDYFKAQAELAEVQGLMKYHPRAAKLMQESKPFLVIAIDEPYFLDAYKLIQTGEVLKGTWTVKDQLLLEALMEQHQRTIGKFDGGWHGNPQNG